MSQRSRVFSQVDGRRGPGAGTFGRSAAALVAVLAGCAPAGEEPIAESQAALDVCNETVPSDRYVDGLPAYQQCDATTGSIWSNNGVDTATSSQGSDWVRTQQGGGYQCTEWAWRYMHFRWAVDYRHGDARQWCAGTLPATMVMSTTPVHGDLIVFDAGVCGADATTGHVAVIDTVDGAKAKATIVEENRAGRRSTDLSCGLCFLHAVANDGMPTGGAGAAGAGGTPGGAGGAFGGAGGKPAAAGGATSGGHAGAPGGAPGGAGAHASGGAGSPGSAGAGAVLAGAGGASEAAGGMATSGGGGRSASPGGRGGAPGGGGEPSAAAGGGGAGAGGTVSGGGPGASEGALVPDGTATSSGCAIAPRRTPREGTWLFALGLALVGRRRAKRPGVRT